MNVFWPVYKQIEEELRNLLFYITVDDEQLSVYSSRIASLIVKVGVEIESISKELYARETKQKIDDKLHFDYVSLKYFIDEWAIDKKKITIKSIDCFISERQLFPFQTIKKNKGKDNFKWNIAYQSLKHDRVKNLKKYGNFGNLFEILAALYILNIYYMDISFNLENSKDLSFEKSFESLIFSIEIHGWVGTMPNCENIKKPNFLECIYFIRTSDASDEYMQEYAKKFEEYRCKKLFEDPKIIQYVNEKKTKKEEVNYDDLLKLIGSKKRLKISQSFDMPIKNKNIRNNYIAVLNKNKN